MSPPQSGYVLGAVDRQRRAIDEGRLVGGEEHDAARDLLRRRQATTEIDFRICSSTSGRAALTIDVSV